MARNIEIKAHISNLISVLKQVKLLSTQEPVNIYQDDTFFNCTNGRLKLRVF